MVKKINDKLIVKPEWVFNTYTVLLLKSFLDDKIKTIEVDFSGTRLVDTDGISFLYQQAKKGKNIILKNPPEIMFDILRVLDIEDVFYKAVHIK